MRPTPAFEDLLNEQLKAVPAGVHARPAPRTGTAASYGFFFMAGTEVVGTLTGDSPEQHPATAVAARRCTATAPSAWIPADLHASAVAGHEASPRAIRTSRVLSSRERQALGVLVELGARLDADFTFDQLRSAFRGLAMSYHPDRHTDRSDAAMADLARSFARAHEAYRVLALRCEPTRH